MAALICDICGGKLTMGTGGIATCESCGMEHTAARLKEKIQEIKGTVRVDNSHMITNYLSMAQTACDAGNHKEAEDYANKIIEIEPQSYLAWHIKAKAAGWQTTGRDNRFSESISSWINATSFAPINEKETLTTEVDAEIRKLVCAILTMYTNSFVSFRGVDNKNNILNNLSAIEKLLNSFTEKTTIDVYSDEFKTIISRLINTAAVNASNKSNQDFGPEDSNRSQFAWNQYTTAQDACLSLFDKAYELSTDNTTSLTICNNYITLAKTVKDSCSYKFEANSWGSGYQKEYTFTNEAKKSRTTIIEKWEARRNRLDPERCKKSLSVVMQNCQKVNATAKEAAGYREYWESNVDKKSDLENECEAIRQNLKQLVIDHDNGPIAHAKQQIATTRSRLDTLNSQQKALGIFKGKEKKALQIEIDQTTNELAEINKQVNVVNAQHDEERRSLNLRIDEINTELKRPRGQGKISRVTNTSLYTDDGTAMIVSPVDLIHFFAKVIPAPYGVSSDDESAIINYTEKLQKDLQALFAAMSALTGNASAADANKLSNGNKENTLYATTFVNNGKHTHATAYFNSENKTATINKLFWFSLESGFSDEDASAFTLITAMALFHICPSSDLDQLQSFVAENIYGLAKDTTLISGNHKITIKRSEAIILSIEPQNSSPAK